jgi:hypothetical protein
MLPAHSRARILGLFPVCGYSLRSVGGENGGGITSGSRVLQTAEVDEEEGSGWEESSRTAKGDDGFRMGEQG